MHVDPNDGCCRECGGTLEITAADESTMTVECEGGHCYLVEPDAFGHSAMKYFLGFHVQLEFSEGGEA